MFESRLKKRESVLSMFESRLKKRASLKEKIKDKKKRKKLPLKKDLGFRV